MSKKFQIIALVIVVIISVVVWTVFDLGGQNDQSTPDQGQTQVQP